MITQIDVATDKAWMVAEGEEDIALLDVAQAGDEIWRGYDWRPVDHRQPYNRRFEGKIRRPYRGEPKPKPTELDHFL